MQGALHFCNYIYICLIVYMWFMLLVKSASIPEDSHLLSLLRKFVQQSCSNDVILIVRASPRGGESLKLLHESCYPMLSNLPDDFVSSSAKHGTSIFQSSVPLPCLPFLHHFGSSFTTYLSHTSHICLQGSQLNIFFSNGFNSVLPGSHHHSPTP